MSKQKYDDDYIIKESIRFYLETQKPAEPFDEHGNLDPSKLDRFTLYSKKVKKVKSYFDDLGNYGVRNAYAFIFAVAIGAQFPGSHTNILHMLLFHQTFHGASTETSREDKDISLGNSNTGYWHRLF